MAEEKELEEQKATVLGKEVGWLDRVGKDAVKFRQIVDEMVEVGFVASGLFPGDVFIRGGGPGFKSQTLWDELERRRRGG